MAMVNRLYLFVKSEKELYEKQLGFLPKLSTTDILIQITECIRFLQKNFTCCILLDIKEAFDTIDYTNLFQKLSKNGVRGVTLEWFECYLTNRNHCVKLGGCLSQVGVIIFGAPQGSVSEPIFFSSLYK